MRGLDPETVDEVSLKLSGLIGVFELMVNLLSGNRNPDPEKSTMLDFSFFVSQELQSLFKKITGVNYR
jgi:hypothetical protein